MMSCMKIQKMLGLKKEKRAVIKGEDQVHAYTNFYFRMEGSIVLIVTMFKVLKSASSVLRAASLSPVRGIKLLLHTRHSSWDKLSS